MELPKVTASHTLNVPWNRPHAPATDNPLLHFKNARIDRELPSNTLSNTETAPPKRATARREMLDPQLR
jgi:hypothetical protein